MSVFKICWTLAYFSFNSQASLVSVVSVLVGIASSVAEIRICAITAGLKKSISHI